MLKMKVRGSIKEIYLSASVDFPSEENWRKYNLNLKKRGL
jgi:hypothetical protein